MDSRVRIDIYFDVIHKNLERRIGCNPDDLDAIDALWEVQTLRLEHAVNSGLFDAEKKHGHDHSW